VNGAIEQKRVSHCLGPVSTKGKRPPKDIEDAAAAHMASLASSKIPAERIVVLGNFVENVYLPWAAPPR
jgi:hypothetical protein